MGRLEALLGRLGALLGRLGETLGRLGALLGRFGAPLGRLGALWNHLGALLGRLGAPLVGHLGDFWPPKTTNEKKHGPIWGALGARCTFSLRKNDHRQNTPLGPQGALGGAFGPSGGPSGPLSKFWGALGTTSFGPWAAQGPPKSAQKKNKNDFWGHLGGANLRLP